MSKQKIQLSDHFDYSRLIRFVLPCIGTMLFTSIYGIVDGLCVSNFVGKTAFAAVNLIMPVPMLVGTVGFMLGTGGSAIVGITLGEGDKARADRYFSLFMSTALIAGIVHAASFAPAGAWWLQIASVAVLVAMLLRTSATGAGRTARAGRGTPRRVRRKSVRRR